MSIAEQMLMARLREPRLQPHRELHPPDGGDTIDTYEGWKRRGYQVQKGASAYIPRHCHGVRFGPVFGWESVSPIRETGKIPARPLKPGEDDLDF
jgi:hypothetical protein